MNRPSVRPTFQPRQSGFALVVAILLLLILTVFSLFATNVGVFEQRTSANEYRAKAISQVADAALNHGAESLRTLDKTIGPEGGGAVSNALWQLCNAADETFPCGAERDLLRRASTYRYIGGVDLDGKNGISVYEQRSVNFPPILDPDTGAVKDSRLLVDTIASSDPANPFPVEYQVGLLLCRVDSTVKAAGVSACTTDPANTTENRAYTLVARAQMTGEQSSATFTKTVVPIEDISLNPKVPSIVSSGVMTGLGNSTIVGNPNSGGFGVPVSVWSRTDFKSSGGSWQTCHYDDWLRSNSTTVFQDVSVCSSNKVCSCPAGVRLSSGGTEGEGIDILDVEGGAPHVGTLLDSQEFPRDLMEFLWGPVAQARDKDADGDGWNETASEVMDGSEKPYYAGQSKRAISFLKSAGFKPLTCDEATSDPEKKLGPNSAGKYWVETKDGKINGDACPLPKTDIGSPDKPVQIVFDGGIDSQQGMRLFGIAFGRDPHGVTSPGGTAYFSPGGGGSEVYGAAVIEGEGTINGSVLVVYDAKTLVGDDQDFNPNVASVPGSWSDRVSY